MANQQHVELLTSDGVDAWNRWRQENRNILPDLSDADLAGLDLRRADLSDADLSHVNLSISRVSDADLSGANLTVARLYGTDLGDAHLSEADLREAGLYKANLVGADLCDADLTRADLTMADLGRANLNRANLSSAGLSGTDLSRANLREANLREANLSNTNLYEADARGARLGHSDLGHADLTRANFTNADLSMANLSGAICLQTDFSGANLKGCTVYGISAWDVNLDGAVQADLRITMLADASGITVDNLEVAQFLYLLLHNQKVRAVLDTVTSKVVLILGRFSAERKPVLDALREALRHHPHGYIPVLFDFEPQQERPVLETVKTLANLSRFVIADLTDPHMIRAELATIVPQVPTVPVQPIIEGEGGLPTEFASLELYKSFLPVFRYSDLKHLLASLSAGVIAPVERHVHARRLADGESVSS